MHDIVQVCLVVPVKVQLLCGFWTKSVIEQQDGAACSISMLRLTAAAITLFAGS